MSSGWFRFQDSNGDDGGVSLKSSPLGSFRKARSGTLGVGWCEHVPGGARPGEEEKSVKRKSTLGIRGFTKLNWQKAEPVGLKWTLFLSGQEGRKV